MSSFQISAGVQVKETDLTNVIPAVSTSIGAFAGYFKWGPINEVRLVSSEKGVVSTYGTPDSSVLYADPFFQATSFLQYGNALKIVRGGNSNDFLNALDDTSANSPASGEYIPNSEYFEANLGNTVSGATFAAKYAGSFGNSLRVYVFSKGQFENYEARFNESPIDAQLTDELISAFSVFDVAPDEGEVHVAVIDSEGNWGEAGNVLETYANVSVSKTAKKSNGATNYIKNVINALSQYVYFVKSDTVAITVGDITDTYTELYGSPLDSPLEYESPEADLFKFGQLYTLSGGTDASALLTGDIQNALDLLADTETEDVNLIFSQIDSSGAVLQNYVHSIAHTRKDAIAFLSPYKDATVGEVSPSPKLKTWANSITERGDNGSYAVMDSTAVYIYDRYNDVYRYIPANGHIAGLCANVDEVADTWFSPAGFNRGGLRGIVKLAFNPTQAERDELYKASVNPIVTFPGQGTLLFGDKTAQSKQSAFDRINVRRLFISLEKAIATAAKFQLFEFNDQFTRASFKNAVEPFLREVQGRRGITDFAVVCDETNNTGEVVDSNGFVADIYVKPTRSINFITLNFVATRTGVNFSEVAGLSNN
jgi:hypothetical protein